MIFLFSDFGNHDIYTGQVKAALLRSAPHALICDLLHTATDFEPLAAAHLLAALHPQCHGGVVLAVVDPGVGSERLPVVVEADGTWFVGPDNGLFSVVAGRAKNCRYWEIVWRPEHLSHSFHGRDLFAPVAAMLDHSPRRMDGLEKINALSTAFPADDLAQIVYVDHYGNAMTGIRGKTLPPNARLGISGLTLCHAPVFSDAAPGQPFWYENSLGLVEIAVNRGNASALLALQPGSTVRVIP